MPYMVVATQGPDTCPAVADGSKQKALAMGPKMEETSKAHGCAIQGGWVNRSNHISYLVMDAPNAHAVEDTLCELELPHWNTVAINPVITVEEAITHLAET